MMVTNILNLNSNLEIQHFFVFQFHSDDKW